MTTFLLFATIFLFAVALLVFLAGIDALVTPFKDNVDWLVGFAAILFVGPGVLTAAFITNGIRRDYCPPIEPIAAPEIAEGEPFVCDLSPEDSSALLGDLFEIKGRLSATTNLLNIRTTALETARNEIVEKTTALQAASAKILELTNANKALEAEVTRLKSVRIDATQRTQTPVPATPTAAPCRGPRCTRG